MVSNGQTGSWAVRRQVGQKRLCADVIVFRVDRRRSGERRDKPAGELETEILQMVSCRKRRLPTHTTETTTRRRFFTLLMVSIWRSANRRRCTLGSAPPACIALNWRKRCHPPKVSSFPSFSWKKILIDLASAKRKISVKRNTWLSTRDSAAGHLALIGVLETWHLTL